MPGELKLVRIFARGEGVRQDLQIAGLGVDKTVKWRAVALIQGVK